VSDSSTGLSIPGPDLETSFAASHTSGPLLDRRHQNCTYHGCPVCVRARRRKGRCFQRVMSGLRLGGNLKLITLTTSEEACELGLSIQSSFRALIMRLRRRNLCFGYVRVVEFTKAGRPHYHVIMRGPYLPQYVLSGWWQVIHRSPVVDVRAIRQRAGAASYLAKYLGKDPLSRYSWSWDWVWRGFAKDWHDLLVWGRSLAVSMPDLIRIWGAILDMVRLKPPDYIRVGGVSLCRTYKFLADLCSG